MCFCVCAGAALLGGNDANDGFVASSGQKTTQARGKVTFGFEMIKRPKKQIKRESLDVEVRRGLDGSIGGQKCGGDTEIIPVAARESAPPRGRESLIEVLSI